MKTVSEANTPPSTTNSPAKKDQTKTSKTSKTAKEPDNSQTLRSVNGTLTLADTAGVDTIKATRSCIKIDVIEADACVTVVGSRNAIKIRRLFGSLAIEGNNNVVSVVCMLGDVCVNGMTNRVWHRAKKWPVDSRLKRKAKGNGEEEEGEEEEEEEDGDGNGDGDEEEDGMGGVGEKRKQGVMGKKGVREFLEGKSFLF